MNRPTLFALLLAWASTTVAVGEMRIFTSQDGRKIEGEIIQSAPDTITLKLSSGQTVKIAVKNLSIDDQQAIARWRNQARQQTRPWTGPPSYNFNASFTKEKLKSETKVEKHSYNYSAGRIDVIDKTDTHLWQCKFNLVNRSDRALLRLKVYYEVYLRREAQSDAAEAQIVKASGTADIPIAEPFKPFIVTTKTFSLFDRSTTMKSTNGMMPRTHDAIVGATIKVEHEGRAAFSWSSGNTTIKPRK